MKLISPREAARRLQVHARTVYRVIDRDEVRQETIRVDRHRVQGDEKSEDLLFTSPAFKEKVQAAGGRLVLCEVGPFLNKFFETAQPAGLLCIRGGEQEALPALTRSAGGGLASFSHAHFAGANGGHGHGRRRP